ncbi:expressed unknown protein [Seminavis robusta]|uniref:Domain of unknown function at the cortex 1 domain-containing protein n=1 Tax=Seminavis robusta TaxID=568900 RepID=A0A9N8H208_9STRA|nr:expressed unknown protein [Seminavis robusta]|eukprot:Sro10_g008320.1 n/a (321) ;mRNA; r:197203-198284
MKIYNKYNQATLCALATVFSLLMAGTPLTGASTIAAPIAAPLQVTSTAVLPPPPSVETEQVQSNARATEGVMVHAADGTQVLGHDMSKPLPLGVPFEFETPFFKGKILLRFRGNGDSESQDAYFGQHKKRLMQTVVQGRFKQKAKMSDVFVGSVFNRPLAQKPPAFVAKLMDKAMKRMAPGIIMDLVSDQPRVVALYAGTAQSVSIDTPGTEPDMMGTEIRENVAGYLGSKFASLSINKRKKQLSSPAQAEQYEYDTDHVYTFHSYDEAVDYGSGKIRVPMYGDYDIKKALGHQPLKLSAVTSQGDVIYSFELRHPTSDQ